MVPRRPGAAAAASGLLFLLGLLLLVQQGAHAFFLPSLSPSCSSISHARTATTHRCWAYYTNDTTAGGGGFALPPIPPNKGVGRVTLVGAGPGDPELLTMAAAKALGTAELVIADRLIPEEVLRCVAVVGVVLWLGACVG